MNERILLQNDISRTFKWENILRNCEGSLMESYKKPLLTMAGKRCLGFMIRNINAIGKFALRLNHAHKEIFLSG